MINADRPDMFVSHDTGSFTPVKPVLITGGAGFIGTNLAARLASLGQQVLIFDNLSRAGVEKNLNWLTATYPQQVHIKIADIRNRVAITQAVDMACTVFHCAAQVGVTPSMDTPMRDFEINVIGTLNLLEAIRTSRHRPGLVYASTSKVYGNMTDIQLEIGRSRYQPIDFALSENGIDETRPLDFHSPHACSKGSADQYVLDYARSYALQATVLRLSSIYGPHQFGNEDQGWITHIFKQIIDGNVVTVYGDGMQVRDILYVDDLVNAFLLTQSQGQIASANAYNIGGGPANTVSVMELIEMAGQMAAKKPEIRFEDWQPNDQKYYISNTSKFCKMTGWKQRTGVVKGLELLFQWIAGSAPKQLTHETLHLHPIGA